MQQELYKYVTAVLVRELYSLLCINYCTMPELKQRVLIISLHLYTHTVFIIHDLHFEISAYNVVVAR